MRQSQLFTKTRREDPKDETAKNAKLLIRAGFIHKELAGVYSLLPLGLLALEKLKTIIRAEMNAVGGTEVALSALQNQDSWQKSGRWSDEVLDVWFKTELQGGGQVGLAPTHEEAMTALMKDHLGSYKDLPIYVYQFQTKFRNELRAKSGLLRGREFIMKDLYSFSDSEAALDDFYDRMKGAYERIYERVGLGELTYITFADGGSFSKYSHEYQTLSEAGEDTIFVSRDRHLAVNKEVLTEETLSELGLRRDELEERRAIEVGNIFKLGTKFSEALGLYFTDQNGQKQPAIMGSYGLGLGRLLATIVEVMSDDRGLVWPRSVAPFPLHLVWVPGQGEAAAEAADRFYEELLAAGREALYDDRPLQAGEKFADSDLLGLPYRVVVSDKTLAAGKWELKNRATGEITMVNQAELINLCFGG